jgi:ribonuclease P protein component
VPAGAAKSSHGLPPARRLRHAAEFKRLYAHGRRIACDGFTAVIYPNDTGSARLGLSVAARLLKLAVQRNRMRRLVRESFRHHQQGLPAVDIVVGLRNAARDADNAQLRRSLEKLWQKINASCARSCVC